MRFTSYETPRLIVLGDAAVLTQGGTFGGCLDPGSLNCCDCLISNAIAFCNDPANANNPICQ